MKSNSTIHQLPTGNTVTKMTLEFEDATEVSDIRKIMKGFINEYEGVGAREDQLLLAEGILDSASVPSWIHDAEADDE